MKRKFYQKLVAWKENNLSTPLMVVGARQIGKTYLIDEFCKNNFEDYILRISYIGRFNNLLY